MTNNEQVNVRDIRGRACLLVIGMAKHLECWTSFVHVLYLYDTCRGCLAMLLFLITQRID